MYMLRNNGSSRFFMMVNNGFTKEVLGRIWSIAQVSSHNLTTILLEQMMLISSWHVFDLADTQSTHCHETVSLPIQVRGTLYELPFASKVMDLSVF